MTSSPATSGLPRPVSPSKPLEWLSPSHLRKHIIISTSFTTPPVATTSAATTSRPHVTIGCAGRWTRFWLFICCTSPEFTDGQHWSPLLALQFSATITTVREAKDIVFVQTPSYIVPVILLRYYAPRTDRRLSPDTIKTISVNYFRPMTCCKLPLLKPPCVSVVGSDSKFRTPGSHQCA